MNCSLLQILSRQYKLLWKNVEILFYYIPGETMGQKFLQGYFMTLNVKIYCTWEKTVL